MSNNSLTNPNERQNMPIIKVLGVGGGGSNAVNHMYRQGIVDVDFLVCNTDAQALESSPVPNKLHIGWNLTEGRGAGNNPERGRQAAEESEEEIRAKLSDGTKMLFITAGMGGGTGTGAAPVIARIACELGILTVGIVTMPFQFEGKARMKQAIQGIDEMDREVDSLLVVNNEKLRKMYGDQKISEAFAKADDVLAVAARGIAEIITVHGHVNVDFADVNTVMRNSGVAIMGAATAAGDNRSTLAIRKALNSPLLNSNDIRGAQNILLNVSSGSEEFRLDELYTITDYVQSLVQDDVQIIWGNGKDDSLGDEIRIVIIATGFHKSTIHEVFAEIEKETNRKVHMLEEIEKETAPVFEIEDKTQEVEMIEAEVSKPTQTLLFQLPEESETKQTIHSETVKDRAKKLKQEGQKAEKKKESSKMGNWIQTTLDNIFNENVQ